ncbi:MAG: DNA polymerase clamp loader subunit A [Candidatus Marinimicrobia bacterium]|jgi:hypothetical protein|nr:DNA polymerase clamp loader subunit A [Candidatus Neomarinimicrobiota bacterium]
MANPFDLVNAINQGKGNILRDDEEVKYAPFMVNKAMSQFPDTIFQAYQGDLLGNLPDEIQMDYYVHSIRPRKRFSKWYKPVKDSDLEFLKNLYNINNILAIEYLSILTDDQLSQLKLKYNIGGLNGNGTGDKMESGNHG